MTKRKENVTVYICTIGGHKPSFLSYGKSVFNNVITKQKKTKMFNKFIDAGTGI